MEENTFQPHPGSSEVYPKESIYSAIYKHYGDPDPNGKTFWEVWHDSDAGVEPRIPLEESYHSLWDMSNFEANEIEFDRKKQMVDGIYSKHLVRVGNSYESSVFLTRPYLTKKLKEGIAKRLGKTVKRKEAQPRVPKSEVQMTEEHAKAIRDLPRTGEGIASTGKWGGICPRLGVGHDCEVSCEGLAAANARSHFLPDEYRGKDGYIQKIQKEKGCRK